MTLGKYKLSGQAIATIIVLIVIIVGVVVYAVTHSDNNKQAEFTQNGELLMADAAKGQVYLANKDGGQLSKAAYTAYSYLTFQAAAPGGGVLAALNAGTPQESFIFTRAGTAQAFSGDIAKQLGTSVIVGLSHQFFFTGDSAIAMVSCPDADTDCSLESMNLSGGTVNKIVDIGVKQTQASFPPAYLVGYSPADHSVFLKVTGSNKLGSSVGGVYQVDINSKKVIHTYDLPALGNNTAALSPDGKQLAYTTLSTNNDSNINVLDLSSGRTRKIQWKQGLLSSQPGTLQWSPDGTKLLVQTANIVIAASAGQTPQPVEVADIDLSNNNTINVLQQIKDPRLETIEGLGWVDQSTVVYQTETTKTSGDFTNPTRQTVRQDVGSKQTTTLKAPAAKLIKAFYY